MIENDPHGLILSAVAISTVLLCLTILWGAYTLIGKFFIAKEERAARKTQNVQATEPAGKDAEIAAAIAIALELYNKENAQVITFDSPASNWSNPARNFRK